MRAMHSLWEEAVATMDRIARAVEPSMSYRHQVPEPGDETMIRRSMSNAACDLAEIHVE